MLSRRVRGLLGCPKPERKVGDGLRPRAGPEEERTRMALMCPVPAPLPIREYAAPQSGGVDL